MAKVDGRPHVQFGVLAAAFFTMSISARTAAGCSPTSAMFAST
ncbi:MAG TPA: hypothetical protein VE198_20135 [Actinoallomurus sp.]|nr:hypothetical protein [Actinoallomurus sp.]